MIWEKSSTARVRLPLSWITAQGSPNSSASLPRLKVHHPFWGVVGITEGTAVSYSRNHWQYWWSPMVQGHQSLCLSVERSNPPLTELQGGQLETASLSPAASCQAPWRRWAPNLNHSAGTCFSGRTLICFSPVFPSFLVAHCRTSKIREQTYTFWKTPRTRGVWASLFPSCSQITVFMLNENVCMIIIIREFTFFKKGKRIWDAHTHLIPGAQVHKKCWGY